MLLRSGWQHALKLQQHLDQVSGLEYHRFLDTFPVLLTRPIQLNYHQIPVVIFLSGGTTLRICSSYFLQPNTPKLCTTFPPPQSTSFQISEGSCTVRILTCVVPCKIHQSPQYCHVLVCVHVLCFICSHEAVEAVGTLHGVKVLDPSSETYYKP